MAMLKAWSSTERCHTRPRIAASLPSASVSMGEYTPDGMSAWQLAPPLCTHVGIVRVRMTCFVNTRESNLWTCPCGSTPRTCTHAELTTAWGGHLLETSYGTYTNVLTRRLQVECGRTTQPLRQCKNLQRRGAGCLLETGYGMYTN